MLSRTYQQTHQLTGPSCGRVWWGWWWWCWQVGQRIVKSQKTSKAWKVAKVIGLEEPSFLNSNTRLAIAKMSPSQNSIQNSRERTTGYCCSFQELEALPGSRSLCSEALLILLPLWLSTMERLMLYHIFSSEERGRSSSQEHLSLSPAGTNGPSATKFIYKTHVLPLLIQFWKNAPEEDVPAQDQDKIAWWARRMFGRRSRKLYITKACPTFLRSSKLSWLATAISRKLGNLLPGGYIDLQSLPIPTHC